MFAVRTLIPNNLPTFASEISKDDLETMAKKEYKQDNPVTMASEPAVAYRTAPTVHTAPSRNRSMSVDEYFDKVKKALDKRYENL